ncbi:hypothetical protein ACJJI3_03295 [Microbulbifer sp. ZKSA004]|uniref:hypothetical protein n=1 Tax=Microbulbifer sp. ZKSA004 TaxID=3243389 RepID=UPI00403A05B3
MSDLNGSTLSVRGSHSQKVNSPNDNQGATPARAQRQGVFRRIRSALSAIFYRMVCVKNRVAHSRPQQITVEKHPDSSRHTPLTPESSHYRVRGEFNGVKVNFNAIPGSSESKVNGDKPDYTKIDDRNLSNIFGHREVGKLAVVGDSSKWIDIFEEEAMAAPKVSSQPKRQPSVLLDSAKDSIDAWFDKAPGAEAEKREVGITGSLPSVLK